MCYAFFAFFCVFLFRLVVGAAEEDDGNRPAEAGGDEDA